MEQWHLTLSSEHRKTLFSTEQLLRKAVRTLDRVVGDGAWLFSIVDSHVHSWLSATRARIGVVGGALRRALGAIAEAVIEVVHWRPVETRRHQRNMTRYLLDQLGHHGIDSAPQLWSGSCYQDLIGARILDRFRPRIRRILPRLHREDLDRAVGVEPCSLREATPEQLRRAGAIGIVEAAAAAFAVGPTLIGRARPVTRARRSASLVARSVEIRTADVADALELPARTVRRLLTEPVDATELRAVRLQVALRSPPLSFRR